MSNIDRILTSRIEQKGCIDVQDNMPRIYGQSEVLNLITQESGVASWNICVGQLEARTRQVGEVEQGGAGHVRGEGAGACDGEEV